MDKKLLIGFLLLIVMGLSGCQSFVTTSSTTCSQNDVNVVLVIDWSESMASYATGYLKPSIIALATSLLSNANNKLSIVMYSTDASAFGQLNPTNSLSAVSTFVNSLSTPTGQTCIGCGLEKAKQMFAQYSTDKNIIVLFSDGAPNTMINSTGGTKYCFTSPTSATECTNYALTKAQDVVNGYNSKIYTIYFQPTASSNTFPQTLMNQIAATGNGQSWVGTLPESMTAAFNAISELVCKPTCDVNSPSYCVPGTERCQVGNTYKEVCQDSDGDTCGDTYVFLSNCPNGQSCDNGVCKCPYPAECNPLQLEKRCVSGSTNTWQVCKTYSPNTCYQWGSLNTAGSSETCSSGKTCSQGSCGCPTSTYNPGYTKCNAANTATITFKSADSCPTCCPDWQPEVLCTGGKTCQGSAGSASCQCPATGYKEGDKRCSGVQIQTWTVNSAGQCPTWSTPTDCLAGQTCRDNACQCPPTQCVNGDTKCENNKAWICQNIGNCNDWVLDDTCGDNEICLKKSPAACYSFFKEVFIVTKDEYSYDSSIDFTIQVQSDILDYLSGTKIYVDLLGDGKVIQAKPEPYLLFGNEQKVTFDPVTQKFNKFEIRVRLEKDTAVKEVIKEIFVKYKIDLKLSNLPPNYVNEQTIVRISVTPSTVANTYTLTNYEILAPDGSKISPSAITLSQIKFMATKDGVYNVKATASATGYTSDEETIPVVVSQKEITLSYYLNDIDISAIPNGYVERGQQTFTVKSVESGNKPRDLDNYDLYLYPPSGEADRVKLQFMKVSTGVWEAEIDLPLYESEYKIIGTMQVYGDNTVPQKTYYIKEESPISFKTVGSPTPPIIPVVQDYLQYILYGGIGVVVLGIILYFVFRKKK